MGERAGKLSMRRMKKEDISALYEIALRSFQSDYEKYGVYPPLFNIQKRKFIPPRVFGKIILLNQTGIGRAFAAGLTQKGEICAVFIDPAEQRGGYGKQVMRMIEESYPKVKTWRLETPGQSYGLHAFYESLGYGKVAQGKEKKAAWAYVYTRKSSNRK